MKYVLITAARNESAFIERTLQSVVTQTQPPERWVIVDDGSTDETPQIAAKYVKAHPWIELVHRPKRSDRSFAGKAYAVQAGWERVQDLDFEVVGNLDADVSFGSDYMAFVMERFEADPALGVGGTPFTEEGGYDSTRDSFEGPNYVAGPCQLFRRACWQDIGGYVPNKAGGVDWIAVMTARMKGWTVRAYPERRFHHHRSMGTAQRSQLSSMYSYGEKDYYLGGSPLWQLFRCAYRMAKRPYIMGGLALGTGYFTAALRRMPRAVSPELMRFHRAEQMEKLKGVFGSLLRLKKVDNFAVAGEQR
jgi:glycosyltransferase involved in cell wall biosynthesis